MLKEKLEIANWLIMIAMFAVCLMALITGDYVNESIKCFFIALVNVMIMVEFDDRAIEESE